MLVSELYTNLEENIINIFNQINKNENVRYLKPKEGKGLYIVFGKLEIRSSIRIYPTKDNNNFSYVIGNKQYILKDSEILSRFKDDFDKILHNYENNISTAPIEELINFTNERKINSFDSLSVDQKERKEDYQNIEKQLLDLPHEHFIEELKILSNSIIENKNLEEKLRKKKKEQQLTYYINSFLNKAEKIFRKEAIKKAQQGEKFIKLSMNNLINNNYLLKEFNTEEINKILEHKFINDRLKKIFKGLNFSINQVNQSYRPYDLILTIEW